REARDDAGEPVIKKHANERDRQAYQTGENAGLNRIEAQGGGDAPFFLDANRSLKRIFQNAGQSPRFLFGETACDLSVAAVNGVANYRRGLDHAVQHNGEPVTFRFLRDVAEDLRAFAVEPKLHAPAFVTEIRIRAADVLTAEVGLLF